MYKYINSWFLLHIILRMNSKGAIDQLYNWSIIWQLENAAHKVACLNLGI